MRVSVGLVAIATAFFLVSVATASENEISEGSNRDLRTDELHFGQLTPSEIRSYFQRNVLSVLTANCDDWSHQDSRVGLLLPIEGAAVLLVGKSYASEGGGNTERIRGIERGYLLESFAKGGAPLEGQVSIKLQADLADEERRCLENLQDVPIRWAAIENGVLEEPETVELVVSEVRFFRFGTLGTDGKRTPTGETLATLKLSESWISMAYRKARENIWGIAGGAAGSACLLLLSSTLGFLVRYLRKARRQARAKQGKRAV